MAFTAHLGIDPVRCPLLSQSWRFFHEVNVQAALDAYLVQPGVSASLHGLRLPPKDTGVHGGPPGLAEVLARPDATYAGVEYLRVPSGVAEHTLCLQSAVLLVSTSTGPLIVLIRSQGFRPYGMRVLEVLAPTMDAAEAFLTTISELMVLHSRFKGQYLQLRSKASNVSVEYRARPKVTREQLVIPQSSLDAIDRQAIGIGRTQDELRAAGRHLKRGLLLHGPPGTGKTHTVGYLASQLPDSTLLVLTGSGMSWLPFLATLIADLAPAIIVLDDVDLIAEDRELPGMAPRALLFSLLDAMDGIADDADVLFVCTTNRPESVERAIAARPGRIDQSIELARPDRAARLRLLELYSIGLDIDPLALEHVADHTEGVTASFMKELLRRAAVTSPGHLGVPELHTVIHEMLDPADLMTPRLLGVPEVAALQRTHQRGAGQDWCGI